MSPPEGRMTGRNGFGWNENRMSGFVESSVYDVPVICMAAHAGGAARLQIDNVCILYLRPRYDVRRARPVYSKARRG